jgi:hypothetical protein
MAGRWRPHLAADRWMLLAFLGIAASLLLFLKLSSEVLEGDTAAFDSAILQAIRHATEGDTPVRNWLRGFMIALTALGDTSVLVLVVLVVTGYLLVIRQRAMALYLFSALALGRIGTALLKLSSRATGRASWSILCPSTASASPAATPPRPPWCTSPWRRCWPARKAARGRAST